MKILTKTKIYKVLILLSAVFVISACSKRTESFIVGVWDVEDVGQDEFPKDASWTFYDDGRVEIFHDRNAHPDKTSIGEWKAFSRAGVVPYIEISGLGELYPKAGMNGKWRVETLNKSILVINRVEFLDGNISGAFLRREFTKQD